MRFQRIPLLLACLALVASFASAQISDPSFEGSSSGNPPSASWTVVAGVAVIEDDTNPNAFLPSHDDEYLRLEPGVTGNATAGHGPHTSNVGQVRQSFNIPSHDTIGFTIDWEFIQNESTPSASFNDFFSVDLVDSGGSLITNVVFIDTGTLGGTPAYTNVPGAGSGTLAYVPNQTSFLGSGDENPAPAGFKRAFVDLTGMVSANQTVSLEISVGNVGDTGVDSVALVDNARLLVADRNGSGASLRILGASHTDETGTFFDDWNDDVDPSAPFEFFTEERARFSIRARGNPSAAWALINGNPDVTGTHFPGFGTANLSLTSPINFLIDGIAPGGGDDLLGTLTSDGENFLEGFIPDGTGHVRTAYQALMTDAGAPSGFSLSAATEVVVDGGGLILFGLTNVAVHPRMPHGTSNLSLADDGFASVSFNFSFYGVAYTEVFANANGNLTFGSGDSDFTEDGGQMLSQDPRIATVWDDLNPSGTLGAGMVQSDTSSTTATISWDGVPEFGATGTTRNHLAVQLYDDDQFTIYVASTSMQDGLTGISPGGLSDPGTSDASNEDYSDNGLLGARRSVPAGTAQFERFQFADIGGLLRDKFDIATVERIHFVPDGQGGYDYFTGLR